MNIANQTSFIKQGFIAATLFIVSITATEALANTSTEQVQERYDIHTLVDNKLTEMRIQNRYDIHTLVDNKLTEMRIQNRYDLETLVNAKLKSL